MPPPQPKGRVSLAEDRQSRSRRSSSTYDAFLSYSHRDQAVAAGIQKGLHRIGRRVGKLNALRVFRDSTDLAANPNLWGKVTDAMEQSRYLIVVLSPQAAASHWVNREVAHWLSLRGAQQLLIVLAEGHLRWDEVSGRLDPEQSDAALPALTEPGVLPTEPLFVDVSGQSPWDPGDPTFRDRVTDLAAPIHGKAKYELASDDVREQRRFRRLRRAAVAALAVLTVAATVFAGIAVVQRRSAIDQRNHSIALSLTSRGQSMLAGSLGGGDISALQQILAAPHVSGTADIGALYTGVVARRDTLKIVQTDNVTVNAMALSPDGRSIAAGGDRTLQLWGSQDGIAQGEPLPGESGMVFSVAFSPDGKQLAAGFSDGSLRLWDAAGRMVFELPATGDALTAVAFSRDGRRIIAGGWDGVQLRDAVTGRPLGAPLTTASVNCVAVSSDGRRIAVGDAEGRIQLFEGSQGAPMPGETLSARMGSVSGIAFSPDGQRLVSGSSDKTVRIWDVSTRRQIGEPLVGHSRGVYGVAFSPDGTRVASGSGDHTIRLWDAASGNQIGQPLAGHTSIVGSVAFAPDGRRLVSGGDDGTVRVWDAEVSAPIGPLPAAVTTVAFSGDGQRLFAAEGNTVGVWDAQSRRQIGALTTGRTPLPTMAVSPDGRLVASGSGDGLKLWSLADGRQIASFNKDFDWVLSVAFSPDGRYIACGTGLNKIWLWDVEKRALVGSPIAGHTGLVYSVAFSPDGRMIASGSADKTVRLWSTETHELIGQPLEGHTDTVRAVAFSPEGGRVVSAGEDRTLRIWDVGTGSMQGGPLVGHTSAVETAAFDRDGARIVSGSDDTTLRLWDAATGQPIGQPLQGHTEMVASVAFSPDGARIVSGGADDTIRLWPAPAQADWAAILCAKLTTNMNRTQWNQLVSPEIDDVQLCQGLPPAAG